MTWCDGPAPNPFAHVAEMLFAPTIRDDRHTESGRHHKVSPVLGGATIPPSATEPAAYGIRVAPPISRRQAIECAIGART